MVTYAFKRLLWRGQPKKKKIGLTDRRKLFVFVSHALPPKNRNWNRIGIFFRQIYQINPWLLYRVAPESATF